MINDIIIPDLKNNDRTSQIDHIMDYKLNPIQSNRQHVKEIHKMQKNVEKGICPRCGGKLVLRTGKNGSTFYGCSNYPKCKFIKK